MKNLFHWFVLLFFCLLLLFQRENSNKLINIVWLYILLFIQLCLTLCELMDCSTPGLHVLYHLPEYTQTHVPWVSDAIHHLLLCHPLHLLPSIFSSSRVFSNELALRIRWPKYWCFSFRISPSNEYSGLISFRIDWYGLLAVQGTLESLLWHQSWEASALCCSAFFMYVCISISVSIKPWWRLKRRVKKLV